VSKANISRNASNTATSRQAIQDDRYCKLGFSMVDQRGSQEYQFPLLPFSHISIRRLVSTYLVERSSTAGASQLDRKQARDSHKDSSPRLLVQVNREIQFQRLDLSNH
jgi:hypothetical protein